ncbi:hypothetical protein GCM10025867_12750 [Frondihabitans sucicola]|uniref:Uncharacterized protein n=1 Tax=Frondihabitans sucicola TaxID=1268041 RepID=A0ABN6XVI6_9MICO|nr:hypothetical protein [Frondihabitans sucicola]BDZ49034.1 hypothetical protein GCM10025867_12750 [Frondihabitans sucicola]
MSGPSITVTGKTLDEIATRVRVEHGPRARIVAAERVTSGGIAGLFAKRYVEATVELPERGRRAARTGRDAPGRRASDTPASQAAFSPTPAQRVGLAALLADAEDAEEAFALEEKPAEPAVSTRSGAFADLMDDLAFNGVITDPVVPEPLVPEPVVPEPVVKMTATPVAPAAPEAPRPAPDLLDGPGDLVVVVGERPDTVAVAQAMAEGSSLQRAAIRVAGSCADGRFVRVTDRRGALEARASGVELDRATFVAVGWDSATAEIVAALAPDQIWFAVDAGRKHADTERFLATASAVIDADGLAAAGLAGTSTPDTVRTLGLPVGWTDA